MEDQTPGWDAIQSAVEATVPAQEPLHWGTNNLPGQGVYGLSAYRGDDHWFLVTFGLSELFTKDSDNPAVSGFGIELTMRIPLTDTPPTWAPNLLKKLGDYVHSSGRVFAEGHRMDPGGPITGAPGTNLTALAFTEDPALGTIDTPHGTLQFLTVVGITVDELNRAKASSTTAVLAGLGPLLVTDPER
ncbi:suppressor of fused domain protein [Lentzea sp. NPDC051838]|uniref:suppressor of fused domain protein n=1 Tax=Lentzea sp. NPDC051838 TaxID=3154849 RepID=UPI003444FCEB